jgi:calcineurin-like phosphoesterase family protein
MSKPDPRKCSTSGWADDVLTDVHRREILRDVLPLERRKQLKIISRESLSDIHLYLNVQERQKYLEKAEILNDKILKSYRLDATEEKQFAEIIGYEGKLPTTVLKKINKIIKDYAISAPFSKNHLYPTRAEANAQLDCLKDKLYKIVYDFEDFEKQLYCDEPTFDSLDNRFCMHQSLVLGNNDEPPKFLDSFKKSSNYLFEFVDTFQYLTRDIEKNYLSTIPEKQLKMEGRIVLACNIGFCIMSQLKKPLITTETGLFANSVQFIIKKIEGEEMENNIKEKVIIPAKRILDAKYPQSK